VLSLISFARFLLCIEQDLFVSGDQLLRGAALNAVLIAEKILELRA
jgi:hypothetical protein